MDTYVKLFNNLYLEIASIVVPHEPVSSLEHRVKEAIFKMVADTPYFNHGDHIVVIEE